MHHVVLFPGVAAVRISRRPDAAAEMPRRVEILRAVAAAGLPFAVPEPLTAVTTFGERAAVAISWIDGEGLPEGIGDSAAFSLLLEALREAEISPELEGVLHQPCRYADGLGWADILNDEVVPGRLRPRPPARSACGGAWCSWPGGSFLCGAVVAKQLVVFATEGSGRVSGSSFSRRRAVSEATADGGAAGSCSEGSSVSAALWASSATASAVSAPA